LSAIGILLAIGFSARGSVGTRPLATASLVILAPTLYFTFSRGAALALATKDEDKKHDDNGKKCEKH